MLKPSEVTPATSALLAEAIAQRFAPDEFTVVIGDADTGAEFTRLPFDHLFFTGSTAVGRIVAMAAAGNLTPVTLELGGKSPAIVDASADLAAVAPRIAVGKLLNAGQTCIAPDYALVPERRVDEFVAAVTRAVRALYPDPLSGDDYTSIVNERHYDRLVALIEDARAKGAKVVTIPDGAAPDPATRRIPPTLLVGATDAMQVMREEIFGPILPVESYAKLDDAIAAVTRRPRPLAFYVFAEDRAVRERLLHETIAGGVTVNDTLWHFAHEELPFGGVGASGIGAYHGEAGFRTFSHMKSVFSQPRLAAAKLLYPPYGSTFEKVLRLLKRLSG
jgi:coniferyl-aldehyde dehydrogenase